MEQLDKITTRIGDLKIFIAANTTQSITLTDRLTRQAITELAELLRLTVNELRDTQQAADDAAYYISCVRNGEQPE